MNQQELRAGAGTLPRAARMVAEARGDLDHLAATVSAQVLAARGRWQGAGGAAFFAVQEAWSHKQHVLVSALADFEAGLLGTERRTEASDDEARTAQHALLQRLDGVRS